MSLSQDFAAILADADALKAALANAGIPQHCAQQFHALLAKFDAMALIVATLDAGARKPAPETK